MSKTREQRRREHRLGLLAYILMIIVMTAIVVLLAIWAEKTYGAEEPRENGVVIYHLDGKDLPDYCEAPFETEIIAYTVEQAIGTDDEESVVGFDATRVMQVITTEGGHDAEVCWACTTAIANTMKRYGNRIKPEEVCDIYQYAAPSTWISDEAYDAVVRVFLYGDMCEDIGEATVFYNPLFGLSAYHEAQEFVAEINGVKFYEEVAE